MNGYTCTTCGFSIPNADGGRMYVVDTAGNRSICPHPGEEAHVARVLGIDEETLVVAFGQGSSTAQDPEGLFAFALSRTGFLSDCLCRNCLAQFRLDVHRDATRCPGCSSPKVTTIEGLAGRRCPKCGKGTMRRGTRSGHPRQHAMVRHPDNIGGRYSDTALGKEKSCGS